MTSSMELTQEQRDLALLGFCPFCENQIRGYKGPDRPILCLHNKNNTCDFVCSYCGGMSHDDPKIKHKESCTWGFNGHRPSCHHKEIRL